MDRSDTIPPDSSGEPAGAPETLRSLEQRLDRASAAAERLLAEAVAAGAHGGGAQAHTAGGGRDQMTSAGGGAQAHTAGGGRDQMTSAGGGAQAHTAGGGRDQMTSAGGGAQAHTAGGEGSRPPAAGFQPLGGHDAAERGLEPLLELLRALRDLIPSDLQRRLVEALRELLLALRSLIDYCTERLERRVAAPAPVRDIPIL